MNNNTTKKEVLGKDANKVDSLNELKPLNETMYDNLHPTTPMKEEKKPNKKA